MTWSDTCGIFDRPLHRSLAARLANRFIPELQKGRLTLALPNGESIERRGKEHGPEAIVQFHHWTSLWRLALHGDEGFVRGYISGHIETPDIVSSLAVAASNENVLKSFTQESSINARVRRLAHALRANTRTGSKRNIRSHYDLGNDFFCLWLDSGMNYSSALYAGDENLEIAQLRKLDRVLELLGVRDGEKVLEIGCGWGAFGERLLQRHDVHYTGVTLSTEQLAYAKSRLQDRCVRNNASLRLQDYRDISGSFEKIASIEMIEAVGEQYWPVYFEKLRRALKEGGRAVIQAITIEESRFSGYRNRPDFIQRYIFPGGMLPTHRVILEQANRVGLKLVEHEAFGDSYAKTLQEWRTRFKGAARELERLGFGNRFRRLWDYYLAYCETGFSTGLIDVGLFTFAG